MQQISNWSIVWEDTAIKDSCYKSSLFDDNDDDRNIIYKSIILLTNSQIILNLHDKYNLYQYKKWYSLFYNEYHDDDNNNNNNNWRVK